MSSLRAKVCGSLTLFTESGYSNSKPSSSSALLKAAETVKFGISKVGMLVSEDGQHNAHALALLESLVQDVEEFVHQCFSFTVDGSLTLKGELASLATSLAHHIADFGDLLESGGNPQRIKQQIGMIWEACDAVKKASLDSKSAIFKALTKTVLVVLKDTVREVSELQQSSASTNGQKENSTGSQSEEEDEVEDNEDDDEDEDDYKVGPISAAELQVIQCAYALISFATEVVTVAANDLLRGGPLSSPEEVGTWESSLSFSKQIRRGAEELGAALYPPQVAEEVSSGANMLVTATEALIKELQFAGRDFDSRLKLVAENLVQATDMLQAADDS